MDIKKIYEKDWAKLSKEKRENYAKVASRMQYDPIIGVKADSFNGIQFYKD
jgi:hypothetical protein